MLCVARPYSLHAVTGTSTGLCLTERWSVRTKGRDLIQISESSPGRRGDTPPLLMVFYPTHVVGGPSAAASTCSTAAALGRISLLRRARRASMLRGRRLPALALTAYGRAEDRVRVLAAGFNLHLAKPADPTELVLAVASLVGRTE